MGILEDIKSLKIQGSVSITLAKLEYLRNFAAVHGFGEEFMKEIGKVEKIRPTEVMSYNVLQVLKSNPSEEMISALEEKIRSIPKRAAEMFYGLVKGMDRMTVMLHCHSSEVVEALRYAHSKGIDVTAIVTETRPAEQGVITARELAEAGIKVEFIVDSAMAHYMPHASMTLVGSDSLRREGVVNKIGTEALAIISREFRKPFVVLSSIWKIDFREGFRIEERGEEEVRRVAEEIRGRIEGRIMNPAFDITPWDHVSFLVLEDVVIPSPSWEDVKEEAGKWV